MTGESDSVYRVHVGGAVAGQVVVGNHNVVINAQNSSVVVRDEPAPVVTRRTRPVSTALPRVGAGLLGRRMELALLMQWLSEGLPVEVCGGPGVGKSALLRRFAADRAAEGRDVVFLHAAGLAAPDVIQELFQSCYDAPGYLPDLRRLRSLMMSIHALVVVDDFEGSVEEFSTLVDVLPAGDLVVSTSRRVAWGRGRSLELQGLDEQAALALMARELDRGLDENVAAALQLCRAANGYPRGLLQAAAWLRSGGAATMPAAPEVPQRALAGGLGERSRRVLTVLCAVAGAHLSPALCRAMTRDAGSPSALEELAGLHLAERSGAGYQLAVDPRTVAGEWGIPPPNAADYLDALLDWTNRVAAPRDIADAAPVIERVLEAAVAHGRPAPACTLARKVAPVLGLTLLWGAWGTVLKLGRDAALASGSAADLAYFEHEDRVRRQALAAAAGAVVVSGAAGKLPGVHLASTHTERKSVPAMMSSHPVATGWVVALVVAAAVAGFMLANGRPAEVESEAYITRLPPPPTDTGGELPGASVPASGGSRPLPPPGGDSCTRYADSVDFGAVAVGTATDRDVSFPSLDCDDESAAFLEADSTFAAKRASCPPSGGSGTCVFRVTFSPRAPGSYTATLIVPDDNGGRAVTIALTGHTPGPGTSANSVSPTPSSPGSPSPKVSAVSPSPKVSAVSPSPTVPQPPPTVPQPPPTVPQPPPTVPQPPPTVPQPPPTVPQPPPTVPQPPPTVPQPPPWDWPNPAPNPD
ncbi:ATP-binding protein [Nocardia sp. NPDC051787]|uniref:ATP-binding protein n=1 Tax=Nocardia sp. NPDC051787 TaxID=3155415 RepID=UPI003440C728